MVWEENPNSFLVVHIGIFGPTRSGKSTLALALLTEAKRRGYSALVCDPLLRDIPPHLWRDVWPGAVWITIDIEEFIAKARRCKRCYLFVEESSLSVKRQTLVDWLFVAAGNPLAGGHTTVVVGQNAKSLLPHQREQISTAYLFKCHPRLAQVWDEQFSDPRISVLAPTLQRYWFLKCQAYAAELKPLRLAPPAKAIGK